MLYINHATILTPSSQLNDGALLTDGSKIVALGPSSEITPPANAEIIDATDLILTPGFIDLQLNGAEGHDFTTAPNTIWKVGQAITRYGVTTFLPTIITSLLDNVEAAQAVLAQGPPANYNGATPLGLHLEGPFLNPAKKGAHNSVFLRTPSTKIIANWSVEQGIRLVTLAPELPNALPTIKALVEQGIVVSASHSLATYQQAQAGFEAGIKYGTHLFNAMPPLGHREPGLVGALLNNPQAIVGLIPDGIHVHPALVSVVWSVLGSKRLNLVTDAMAALGMPPGHYKIGDLTVDVTEHSARLADGTLAGSILPLNTALKNLMAFAGCSLQEALPTITSTPANLLGCSQQFGQLNPNATANLVLLNSDFNVVTTIVNGKIAYQSQNTN